MSSIKRKAKRRRQANGRRGKSDKRKIEEAWLLAEEYKRRFEFAYFLDSFEDELREERTIDTVSLMFKSKKNVFR